MATHVSGRTEAAGRWMTLLADPEASGDSGAAAVAMLRWPEERADVEHLRAVGRPRLLLVSPGEPPPIDAAIEEDWVRLPATDDDIRAKAVAVAMRSASIAPHRPIVADGCLRFGNDWVALSPIEDLLVGKLVDHFGELVPITSLTEGLDGHLMTPNAVRVHVMRLRKRIRPLGLAVRTLHGRGYLLEADR